MNGSGGTNLGRRWRRPLLFAVAVAFSLLLIAIVFKYNQPLTRADILSKYGAPIASAASVEYRSSGRAMISGMELVVKGLRNPEQQASLPCDLWILSDDDRLRLTIRQLVSDEFGADSATSGYFAYSPSAEVMVIQWSGSQCEKGTIRKYSVNFLVPVP